eukprot:154044_1
MSDSEGVGATQDCGGWVYFTIPFVFINSIVLFVNVFALYQFIFRYKSKMEIYTGKPPKPLFCMGLTLVISIVIIDILMIGVVLAGCAKLADKKPHQIIIQESMMIMYILQGYFLALFVFTTLRYSFDGSKYAVQKRTKRLFHCMYITIPILTIASQIFRGTKMAELLMVVLFLVLLTLLLSLIGVFIRKLITIYKHLEAETLFITKITKLTTLNCISISLTLLVPLIIIVISATSPKSAILGSAALLGGILLDTTTNLWCVVMTYSYFSDYYGKICCYGHNFCQYIWIKYVGGEERILAQINEDAAIKSVASLSPGSSNSTNQSDSGKTNMTATDLVVSIEKTQSKSGDENTVQTKENVDV